MPLLESVAQSLLTHVKQMKKSHKEYFFILHIGQILKPHSDQYGFKTFQMGILGPHSVSVGLNGMHLPASIKANTGSTSFQ